VTNNISESFNHILKRHQDWKEVSVDATVMVFCQLQIFYRSQIARSCKGFGPYILDNNKPCSMFTFFFGAVAVGLAHTYYYCLVFVANSIYVLHCCNFHKAVLLVNFRH